MTQDAEDKHDHLTSYLANFAVNEWTGQNVGVTLHGGGWSASQLEDLERKTKKGEGEKKKQKPRTNTHRRQKRAEELQQLAYSSASNYWDFWASYRDVPKVLQTQLLEILMHKLQHEARAREMGWSAMG